MTFSLNEVETLVRKAALGAGIDPGRANDLAAAAIWLTDVRVPVFEIVHRALTLDGGAPLKLADDGTHADCPATSAARTGPSTFDILLAKPPGFRVVLDAVDEPLLVAALAAITAARNGATFTIEISGQTIAMSPGTIPNIAPLMEGQAGSITLARMHETATPPAQRTSAIPRYDPASIPDSGFAALARLAHQTYVPATVESRLSGAGAGLTDND